MGRKLSVMREPEPAAIPGVREDGVGRGGGGAKVASSIRAFCLEGIKRGRFSGLAKKAKTISTG